MGAPPRRDKRVRCSVSGSGRVSASAMKTSVKTDTARRTGARRRSLDGRVRDFASRRRHAHRGKGNEGENRKRERNARAEIKTGNDVYYDAFKDFILFTGVTAVVVVVVMVVLVFGWWCLRV